MLQNRVLKAFLLLIGITGLLYVAVSLFIPSPSRLTFGIDRETGDVRLAESGVTYLPLHEYRRISFTKRDGAAQNAGLAHTRSKENVPIRIAYRIRFLVKGTRLPDARRIVIDGWDPWFSDRIGEAVRALTSEIRVEELISPTARYNEIRENLRLAVANHLNRNGIEVTAFEIESLEIDRDALLSHKRQELRLRARSQPGKIVMIGIDGADWSLIGPLLDSGRMPNLSAILREGVRAEVESLQPLVTPLVWTSLSTGTLPSRHGIVDFYETGAEAIPVSARTRNAPALWEIASAFERSAAVIDWWAAWPPLRGGASVVMPDGRIANVPDHLAQRLEGLRIAPETIGHPQISRFAEVSEERLAAAVRSSEPGEPLVILREALTRTWTSHRVGLELYQSQDPDLFMLGFPAADVIHHVFGPFHPPFRDGVDNDDQRTYWPVVTNFYGELDRLLGEWLRILPEEATLMIVSAHGHRWDRQRPVSPPLERSDLSSHRETGVMIVSRYRVDPSRAMKTIDLLDITPAVLTLLGLPVAEEMRGSLLPEFLVDLRPVDSVEITSYSDLIELDRRLSRSAPPVEDVARRLRQIGHLGPETGPERESEPQPDQGPEWGDYARLNNEAVRLIEGGDLELAERTLREAIRANPDRYVPHLNLAVIALDAGRYDEAERFVWRAIDADAAEPEQIILDLAAWYRQNGLEQHAVELLERSRKRYPDSFTIVSNLGSALAAAGRTDEAIEVLESALGMRPTSTQVLNNLGSTYARKNELSRALDYWNRSLQIVPRQPKIAAAARAAVSRL